MPDEEITVQGLFDVLTEWGGALMQVVPRDENDVALRAVIVVDGQPETDEILAAVAEVQERWNA